jgi:hypothetical protein
MRKIADRRGKASDQLLLVGDLHLGIGKDHRLAAAMRQASISILKGHRSRQPEGFLGTNIGRHAHGADCRSAGDVVDRDHRLKPDGRSVNVNQFQGPQVVGEAKYVLHHMFSTGFIGSRATRSAIRPRCRPGHDREIETEIPPFDHDVARQTTKPEPAEPRPQQPDNDEYETYPDEPPAYDPASEFRI